jgi:methionyl-tRNA synthetase
MRQQDALAALTRSYDGLKSSVFTIGPKVRTTLQNHHEAELFIVLQGTARIETGNGSARDAKPGDMLHVPPLQWHVIANPSDTEHLLVANLWWAAGTEFTENMMARIQLALGYFDNHQHDIRPLIVLPSFTTPNGPMHLGHLAGPVIAADVVTRLAKLRGGPVVQLCGTIGHQTHVEVAGRKIGKSFFETAMHYSGQIHATLKDANVAFDTFVTLEHKDDLITASKSVMERFARDGYLKTRTKPVPVCLCSGRKRFLFEANVTGRCPHCKAAASGECENCARYFADDELEEPVCTACGQKAQSEPLERQYFDLEPHREIIERLLLRDVFRDQLRPFVTHMLTAPLPEIPITILANDGVAAFRDGHVLYSAFELLPRLVAALRVVARDQSWGEDWEQRAVPGWQLAVFFGIDNAYLRCVIFPILLHAYAPQVATPEVFVTNAFYNLNGDKFSTSRNNRLFLEDLVASGQRTRDEVRLYLCANRPDVAPTNFTRQHFESFADQFNASCATWLDGLEADLSRATVPVEAGSWCDAHIMYYWRLKAAIETTLMAYSLQTFDLKLAARTILSLPGSAHDFNHKIKGMTVPSPAYERTTLILNVMTARAFGALLQPIAPELAAELLKRFGFAGPISLSVHELLTPTRYTQVIP